MTFQTDVLKKGVHCDLQLKPKSVHKEFLNALIGNGKSHTIVECYKGNLLPKSMISWSVKLTMNLMKQHYDKSEGLGPFNIKTKIDEITHPQSFCLILKKLNKKENEKENNDNSTQSMCVFSFYNVSILQIKITMFCFIIIR